MKRTVSLLLLSALLILTLPFSSNAGKTHTVVRGDSLWKIAKKYEVGLSEIKAANGTIKNFDLIYPGDVINVPTLNEEQKSYEAELVRLVNAERSKEGLKPLSHNWELSRVARYKSTDMSENSYFSHNSKTYGTPFQMIKNFGISYKSAGENIARGQKTPALVVSAWMNSSGHRANILNPAFTEIGVGYEPNGNYWTQMFIG